MKQITQPSEITFTAIEFKDAVALLPLMNGLSALINHNNLNSQYRQLPTDEDREAFVKEHGNGVKYPSSSINIPSSKDAEKFYKVLTKLGFCTNE